MPSATGQGIPERHYTHGPIASGIVGDFDSLTLDDSESEMGEREPLSRDIQSESFDWGTFGSGGGSGCHGGGDLRSIAPSNRGSKVQKTRCSVPFW